MNSDLIPCAKWIKRGVARSKPEVFQLSKDELKVLVDKAKSQMLETAEKIKTSSEQEASSEGDQIGMEDYDKEEGVESLIGIGNLITLDDGSDELQTEGEDEDDSDKEDEEIKPTDNLIAVGHVFGDLSVLEVYVYNEEAGEMFIHHDFMLPTIPLALEWLNFVSAESNLGNFLAMGGMTPEITVWDLDIVNSLEPVLRLGEFSDKKKHQHRNHGHRDAVLDLAWNAKLPHVLASGSVDQSVLLWDLEKTKAVTRFNEFQEKVQSIQWHPSEVNILIAGSCDSTVRMLDCRVGESLTVLRVEGEVEGVAWHPTKQFSALVGTSEGVLCCADCRSGKVQWTVKAHAREVSGLAVTSDKPDVVLTSSTDQTVKAWNISGREPELLYTKHTAQGELQCIALCPDNPDLFLVGGNKKGNSFAVFNHLNEMQRGERGFMETEQEVIANDEDT